MTDQIKIVDEVRAAWEQPELRRIEASDAEAIGASGDDGVIGTS